jgi:hypothetical protein
MMRLKVEKVEDGLHPSELVVSVRTKTGTEELTIHPRSLKDNAVVIGWPVGFDDSYRLVELPRPTSRGARRIWVNKDDLIEDEPIRATA